MGRVACVLTVVLALAAWSAVAETKPPDCFKDVAAGEWALYEMPGGMRTKYTILEVTPEKVVMQVETIMNGQSLHKQKMDVPRKGEVTQVQGENAPKPKIYKGKAKVKDKEIDCVVIEQSLPGGQTVKNYISNAVPCQGIVKSEMGGQTNMKLIDYGKD